MDYEDINGVDILLRVTPNVQIRQERKKDTPIPNRAKEEIKLLHLSDNSQQMVMETLKFIHGPDYELKGVDSYEDRELKYKNKFVKQSNLVVKGAYHNTDTEGTEADRLKMFAFLKLESYGFHKNHCQEAFEHCDENMEEALILLYSKYIGNITMAQEVPSDIDLKEQKQDEKGVLESIYEKAFEEKIPNSVYIVKLKLDYLLDLYHPQRVNKPKPKVTETKDKKLCHNYIRGHCKFGSKCRFSHVTETKTPDVNQHLNNYSFELEIRIPSDSRYPYDVPMLFLKTDFPLPELVSMHICKKLHEEAVSLAQDGFPSVYSIVELLKNDVAIGEHLKNINMNFPSPLEKLIKKEIVEITSLEKRYKKGFTNKDNKKQLTVDEIAKDNRILISKLKSKLASKEYLHMLNTRKNLPAWSLRNTIINTVRSSQVTVISGETGCGKSTQVPQFFLEDWISAFDDDKKHTHIICTQPRRISAIGVAERVAQERGERIGETVGYQIRLENKISKFTRLTFCTTGIMLRQLEYDPNLSKVSHVIIDEVHERSEENDFLLMILKDLIKIRKDLKIVLMSATLNATLFSDYFGSVPIVEIPGRTFPVDQYFLEDVINLIDYVMEENSQFTRKIKEEELEEIMTSSPVLGDSLPNETLKDERLSFQQVLSRYRDYSLTTCKNLFLMDPEKINLDLIEAILQWLISDGHDYPMKGSILVFLPGIAEITALYDRLRVNSIFTNNKGPIKYKILPLHSSLSSEDQALIFKNFENTRKIILSTNLAETSVTIDDCVFVVDSGKMKEKHFDSNRNMESLEMVWATRANTLQRKGRAGRVMSGFCFHLFTNNRFKHHMLSQPIPEIHRVPLEQLLLHIKILPSFDNRTLHDVLESTLEPPVKDNIDSAILRLKDVGAFDKDNNLTPLGHHLAALPVDVRIGKLMLYGAIFSCVDATLTMAATLSYKSPFVVPFNKKDEAMAKKREFSTAYSDHLTLLQVYKKWQIAKKKGYLAGRNFAEENYLSIRTLEMLADIKYQLLELLVSIGFVPVNLTSHRHSTGRDDVLTLTKTELNQNADNTRLLSSVLCAALYPNIVKVWSPQTTFLRSAAGAVPMERKAKELRFKTQKEDVFLHPSSINFSTTNFPSPYLVYQEKVKTSKIFIRDCSMVPIIPLVLFSGSNVDVCVNDGTTYITLVDGWIRFHVDEHKVAEIIKAIRIELLNVLEEKIKDPLLNLLHDTKTKMVIDAIIHITCND